MLDGRVAIVTGAGRGLGRVEAIELARLGASVVVNDLGVAADGSGVDHEPAESVVEEIRQAGGKAVPHYGDVADWNDSKALLQKAISEFGDMHILLNNAGFCRDRMLFKMSEEEFDAVIRVHLKGHFCNMRHAAEYWRGKSKQAGGPIWGRLISTSSEAFLMGNSGQPNYAAAKAGIVAMTMEAARECIRWGVTANVICPRARTRMIESSPWASIFAKPDEGFDHFAPENVTPIVAYLCSPHADNISGQVFIPFGKTVTVLSRPQKDNVFESPEAWTIESLAAKLDPHFEKLEPVADGFAHPEA